MRLILFVLAALAVISSGFWAYRENYATQATLENVRATRSAIADARDRLAVLRAEWAYLNRPDRLRDLADLNYDKLGLSPLRSDQFGRIDQVAYPQPEMDMSLGEPISFTTAGARP